MTDFDEFLKTKKIDAQRFAQAEPERYDEWRRLFGQVSANSFVAQKLFLVNQLRREFPLPKNG